MSSGGSQLSSFKPRSVIEENQKHSLPDKTNSNIDIKRRVENPDSKPGLFLDQRIKSPGLTSPEQLHHYARNLIMVQR